MAGERAQIALMYALTLPHFYAGYDELDATPMEGITSAFSDWARTIDQKLPTKRTNSSPRNVTEYQEQNADRDQRTERRNARHNAAD